MTASPAEARLGLAIRHHRAGRLDEAAIVLESLIADAPEEARALLLLALVRDARDEPRTAAGLYQRYLARQPDDGFALHRLGLVHQRLDDDDAACRAFARAAAVGADDATIFNDLANALFRRGETARALAALDRAVALDPANPTALCNRGRLLAAMHRPSEAASMFRAVGDLTPRSASDWLDRAAACRQLGDIGAAEAACRQALACGDETDILQARLLLAQVLEQVHRGDEASRHRRNVARQQGVVTRPCLGNTQARILVVGGAGLCNLPTDFLLDRHHFDLVNVFVAPDDHAQSAGELPDADLAFNIVGDADTPFLAPADAVLRQAPWPVLNPPQRIAATRRDRLPALLAGIDGLVVPDIARLSRRELMADAARLQRFALPALVRPVGSHGGTDLRRADTTAELLDAVSSFHTENCYISQYHNYRSADGLYRKYRLVFVGGEAFPVHLAICADWLAHYWRADMADGMLREEDAFLADHRAVFAGAAGAALDVVGRRLGLDFGGVDCAILTDGRLLLFEANATMLVHTNGASSHKREKAIRIRDAMSRLILERCRHPHRADRLDRLAGATPPAPPIHAPTCR